MGRELFVVKGMEKPDWPTKKKKKEIFFPFSFQPSFTVISKIQSLSQTCRKIMFLQHIQFFPMFCFLYPATTYLSFTMAV